MTAGGDTQEMESGVGGSARRRARQVALQVLYAIDLGSGRPRGSGGSGRVPREWDAAAGAPDADAAFESVASHFEMPGATRSFAHALVVGVRKAIDEIDATVASCSRNWRVDRMAAVDRNILRLATWELLHTDTPVPVVLDEAIDLARRFADDPSPAFVNGILDAVARAVREPES